MIVTIRNKQKDLSLSLASIRKMIPFLLEKLGVYTDEIVLYFLDKKEMGKVHELFFSDPSPTDCMSFPLDAPVAEKPQDSVPHVLGGVFVCPQIAVEYAEANGIDPYREVSLYIIHAILHLIGHDDQDTASRKIMRNKEKTCLKWVESFSIKPRKKLLS